MADIIPFRAVRYNKKNISDLICPPYDIISPSEKNAYLKKNHYNAVRIELPENYHTSKKNFELWLSKKVLIKDTSPSFYIYEQSFSFKGRKYVRCGFFALLKTEKFGNNIFPHEKTLSKPKQDRFNLLRISKISTSPIFCLFSDPPAPTHANQTNKTDEKRIFSETIEKIKKQSPTQIAEFSGISEKMWSVSDEKTIILLKNILKKSKILIADGHHRYETFFEFTKGGYVLTFLCPFENKGLLILPTHRLIKNWTEKDTQRIKSFFSVNKEWDFKFYTAGRFYRIKIPKEYKGFLIEFLHSVILKNKEVEYNKNEDYALQSVDKEDFSACVIVKPLSTDILKSVITKRRILPPKSTYFYPKVSTGFVFNELY